ncbi:MAG TPA: hypothetical protein VFA34_13775 [Actinomycetota bacterium]|nr:hypothetical protein [Actinomycetota bacterium]
MQSPAAEAFGAKFMIKAVFVVLLSLTLAGLNSRAHQTAHLDMRVPAGHRGGAP